MERRSCLVQHDGYFKMFLLLEIKMVLDVVNFNLFFAHLGLIEFFFGTNSVVLEDFCLVMIQK